MKKDRWFHVTIDGLSSSGKSTVAKMVAKQLGLFHLDSGAIYRSFALWMELHQLSLDQLKKEKSLLDRFDYRLEEKKGTVLHFLGEREVSEEIRSLKISQKSSKIATFAFIREKINALQKKLTCNRSAIIEGRDAGSVVFPSAVVKLFLTASEKQRVERRFKELQERGETLCLEEVRKELVQRDRRDSFRKEAPVVMAKGVQVIDTTKKKVDQVVCEVISIIRPSKGSFFYRLLSGTLYRLFRIFYRIEARGLHHYPRGAAMIAPNHSSFLDPPAVGLMCPNQVYFLAQKYLFRKPFFRWLFPKINTFPVSGKGEDISVLKRILSLLSEGKQIVIFPEGRRSEDHQLASLKGGIALLASLANCKVVPTTILGAHKAWPRGKTFPKLFQKIIVVFGKPLDWKDYQKFSKKEGRERFMKDLEKAMKALGRNRSLG